jgi:hypothetical protein
MLNVGIITSDTSDNKLYYGVNQRYEHYLAFKAIFTDEKLQSTKSIARSASGEHDWKQMMGDLPGLRLAIASGVLANGSGTSKIDLLFVGTILPVRLKKVMKAIEKLEGRELNYTLLSYDEFYYRLSVHDKFITEILNSSHEVVVDTDGVLKG